MNTKISKVKNLQKSTLATPSVLDPKGITEITAAMNALLADIFALYFKTKNFHWHVSGPHFRDYHLLLDEQAGEILAITDDVAERVRKIGGITLHSIGQVSKLQRLSDNNADYVEAADMLAELIEDNKQLARELRAVHVICDQYEDIATASLIEEWVDQAEKRIWFLFETSQSARTGGH